MAVGKVQQSEFSVVKLFNAQCEFAAGAMTWEQMPKSDLPEVAFVGRSNVGKSSLINALVGRTCARVSKTPGRTQQINFFSLGGRLMLADLPGYGYASVSKQIRATWDKLIFDYLSMRENLQHVFVLIDSRRRITDGDEQVMTLLRELGRTHQVVFTKADAVAGVNLPSNLTILPSIVTSARMKTGIKELRAVVSEIIQA